jgi:uncharacterized protein (UPF0248 family)
LQEIVGQLHHHGVDAYGMKLWVLEARHICNLCGMEAENQEQILLWCAQIPSHYILHILLEWGELIYDLVPGTYPPAGE